MSKKITNKIDFDFLETSKVEKISFNKTKKINGILNTSDEYKQYIDDLLMNHNLFVAKREIYRVLSGHEFIKNSGVALEYFLLDYLEGKIKLDKRNPEKWESNGIDLFYRHLGIQMSIELNPNKKENQLNKLRNKINSGENLFYEEKEDETGDIYNLAIPNREIPKNLGLLKINPEIIRGLINSGPTNRFLVNLKSLSDEEFIKFYNDFEIIKKSFPFLMERINYIENNRNERLKFFSQNREVSFYFDQKEYEKYIERINFWVDNGEIGTPPDVYIPLSSNITYLFNREKKEIEFFVYRKEFKHNESDKLVYSFKHYFCDKKNVNNSFIKPILKYKNEEEIIEEGILSPKRVLGKRKFIQSKIKIFTKKISDLKNKIKKIKINEEQIEKKFISKITREVKKDEFYQKIKSELELINRDKTKKEEFTNCINKLKLKNSEIIEIKKLKTWLEVFIENLKKLLSGENINFSDLQSGIITDKELLLNDSVIENYKFLNRASKLKNDYSILNELFDKIECKKVAKNKFSLKLQKLLFMSNTKSNGGQNFVKKHLLQLEIRKQENNGKLETFKSEYSLVESQLFIRKAKIYLDKNKLNKKDNLLIEINNLEKENQNIDLLVKNLMKFQEEILLLRKNISKIDFKKLLISNLDETNLVYTNKFLSNIMISLIFNGDNLSIRNIENNKLEAKLNSAFLGKSKFDEGNFIKLIELYISFKDVLIDNKITEVKEKINNGVQKIEKQLKLLNYQVSMETDEVSVEYKDFFEKSKEISKVLELIFSDKIIKNYKVSINNFIVLFLSNKKINFDKAFLELVQKIGVENIKEFGEKSKLIEKFNENKAEIEGFNGFEIELEELKTIEDFRQVKIEIEQTFNDFEFKVGELSEIKEQLK